MLSKRRNNLLAVATLVVALGVLAGCTHTPTPLPTPTPIPLTATLVPPTVEFVIQPSTQEITVGLEVAIVAKIEPPQKIDLTWSVTGTSGGKVFPEKGWAVIYTAGGNPGTDIVTAEGTTAGGVWIKQSTSFKVNPPLTLPPPITLSPTFTPVPPTATPTPTKLLTPTGCNFTSRKMIRSPLPPASGGATASFLAPQECETGIPADTGISVGGTATNVPRDRFLWLLNYASGNYYPQCDNVSKGECGANLSRGTWGVMAYLGRRDCKEQLHLVLVTVNESDNARLTQEMVQRVPSGDFGFTRGKLPSSIEEVASIEVETAGGICN
jgi:hypothetical protein